MTSILITGANSFIGANFMKYSQFRKVREISLKEINPEDIDFNGVDVVLHLAAIVHQSKKIEEKEYFRVNSDLSVRVAERAKKAGVKHFIFLSTIKVYGNTVPESGLRNESSKCYPDDAYGKSKYAAEVSLMAMEDASFIVSIIRTPLVYGEGVRANMASLIRLVDSFPLLPFAKTGNRRNFTFTENLVGFIDRIIEMNVPGIFIAMDKTVLSTNELVVCISKHLGKRVYLFKLPRFLYSIFRLIIPEILERLYGSLELDNSLTTTILNYEAPFSTDEGIKRTVRYYLNIKKQ
jgi:UDP-glucose 4-epimerase